MSKKPILYIVLGIIILIGFWGSVAKYFFPLDPSPEKDESIYYNNSFGYKYIYKDNFELDISMEKIKTTFTGKDIKIKIYYDNFKDSLNNTNSLINYGNKHIQNNDYIDVDLEKTLYKYGLKIKVSQWKRKKLNSIENDLPCYTLFQYILSDQEAYTVLIKTDEKINYKNYIWKIGFIEKTESVMDLNMLKLNSNNKYTMDTRSRRFYNGIFKEKDNLTWGIFYPEANKGNYEKLNQLEEKLSWEFKVLLDYKGLKSDPYSKLFDLEDRIIEYTFQVLNDNEDPSIMYQILEGKYDDVINEIAKVIKEYKGDVLFRLNNEMNGDWCSYSAWFTQMDTEIYIEVWKYFHEIFQNNQVDNVLWVWNPNWGDFPEFKWNHYLNYFPGEEYVDVVGLTGYNTGNYYKHEYWREFEEIYNPMMKEYKEYFDYEFIITEFGSNSIGGDKALWIKKMMKKIKDYDINIAIWFSSIDYDNEGNPARIYLLDEKKETLDAFKEGLIKYYE